MKPWVTWLILGVLSLAFGVFVLASPVAASLAVIMVAGIRFASMGGAQFYTGIGADETMPRIRVSGWAFL